LENKVVMEKLATKVQQRHLQEHKEHKERKEHKEYKERKELQVQQAPVVRLDRKDPEVEVVALDHKEPWVLPDPQGDKVYREQLARLVRADQLVKPEQLVRADQLAKPELLELMALKGLPDLPEQF
jgi:hypothetical protein